MCQHHTHKLVFTSNPGSLKMAARLHRCFDMQGVWYRLIVLVLMPWFSQVAAHHLLSKQPSLSTSPRLLAVW